MLAKVKGTRLMHSMGTGQGTTDATTIAWLRRMHLVEATRKRTTEQPRRQHGYQVDRRHTVWNQPVR